MTASAAFVLLRHATRKQRSYIPAAVQLARDLNVRSSEYEYQTDRLRQAQTQQPPPRLPEAHAHLQTLALSARAPASVLQCRDRAARSAIAAAARRWAQPCAACVCAAALLDTGTLAAPGRHHSTHAARTSCATITAAMILPAI